MEGNIKPIYQITMNLTEAELHDLLLELQSVVNQEPDDGFNQYEDIKKFCDTLQLWLGNMKNIQLL